MDPISGSSSFAGVWWWLSIGALFVNTKSVLAAGLIGFFLPSKLGLILGAVVGTVAVIGSESFVPLGAVTASALPPIALLSANGFYALLGVTFLSAALHAFLGCQLRKFADKNPITPERVSKNLASKETV